MESIADDTFSRFLKLIEQKSGMVFQFDRPLLLHDKILQRMEMLRCDSSGKYLIILDNNGDELKELINLITVGETYFFRNKHHVSAFTDLLIPKILKSNEKMPSINIWCAGCSTGEEAYTFAILLLEYFKEYPVSKISITASDINSVSLDFAKKGVYSARSVAQVPLEILDKYFRYSSGKYFLREDVRKMVTFQHVNLVDSNYYINKIEIHDLIICRNVFIYLHHMMVSKIIANFTKMLKATGYLLLGHADSPWKTKGVLNAHKYNHCYFYSKGQIDEAQIVTDIDEGASRLDLLNRVHEANSLAKNGSYQQALDELEKIIKLDELNIEAHYLRGILYEKLTKFDAAIEAFNKVLYIDSNISICYFHIGGINAAQKQGDKAQKAYENCLKILSLFNGDDEVKLGGGATVQMLAQASARALSLITHRQD